jgi:hypothetical protein
VRDEGEEEKNLFIHEEFIFFRETEQKLKRKQKNNVNHFRNLKILVSIYLSLCI